MTPKQKASLRQRIRTPDLMATNCGWCGDGTPSERKLGNGGLSPTLCRRHKEHKLRHGHPAKPSWRAHEYRPYVRIAERFIRDVLAGKRSPRIPGLAKDYAVKATVEAFAALVSSAGHAERHLPKKPKERARAILARMRAKYLLPPEDDEARRTVRQLTPHELGVRLVSVVTGMELAHAFDPEPGDAHYLHVQVGKALHRLAGGHHRAFAQGTHVLEMNAYGDSMGRELATLGELFQERSLMDRHHAELVELARAAIALCPIERWTPRLYQRKAKRAHKPAYKPVGLRGHDQLRPLLPPAAPTQQLARYEDIWGKKKTKKRRE